MSRKPTSDIKIKHIAGAAGGDAYPKGVVISTLTTGRRFQKQPKPLFQHFGNFGGRQAATYGQLVGEEDGKDGFLLAWG